MRLTPAQRAALTQIGIDDHARRPAELGIGTATLASLLRSRLVYVHRTLARDPASGYLAPHDSWGISHDAWREVDRCPA